MVSMFFMTAGYFAICSILLLVGFSVYARALLLAAYFREPLKFILSTLIYFIFACFGVAPVGVALKYIEPWNMAFNADVGYALFFMTCYLLAATPGWLHFRKEYMAELRAAGYFNNR